MAFLKKFRTISWLIEGFLKKHGKLVLFGLIIGISGFFVLPKFFGVFPYSAKQQRIGIVGNYTPDNLPPRILDLLGDGLTEIGDNKLPQPALAKQWEVSEDGKEYIFVLKENIQWQGDDEITADEIKLNYRNVTKTVIDAKTLKFTLEEPFAPFPLALSNPIFKESLIGSGPYQVETIDKKGAYVEKISLTSKKDNIIFRFYPSLDSAVKGFKLGEVDRIENLLQNPFAEKWMGYLKVNEVLKKDEFIAVFFNTATPKLKEKSIRQALTYAIPDKGEGERRALTPIHPDSWAYNSNVKKYEFDPQHAQNLLETDTATKSASSETELTIHTSQPFLDKAEEIQKSWQNQLGFKVNLELVNTLPEDYEIFIGIQKIPPDPDQYIFWHSTRSENITNFKNPKIDKLLEDARRTIDFEERKNNYYEFQKTLLEESPVAFLSHPVNYSIERKSSLIPF
jgi:peptide/nickel transport system substrate-binding protein